MIRKYIISFISHANWKALCYILEVNVWHN